MAVTDRWVRELLKRYEEVGDRVVVHGLRGRASNRKMAESLRRKALRFLRQPDWRDFGPTFASEYLERNGRMMDVYTDRHSMFAVTPKSKESRKEREEADRLTQIGRALRELGIGWIAAFSPQAKGRVERSFGTDQDFLGHVFKVLRVVDIAPAAQASSSAARCGRSRPHSTRHCLHTT